MPRVLSGAALGRRVRSAGVHRRATRSLPPMGYLLLALLGVVGPALMVALALPAMSDSPISPALRQMLVVAWSFFMLAGGIALLRALGRWLARRLNGDHRQYREADGERLLPAEDRAPSPSHDVAE